MTKNSEVPERPTSGFSNVDTQYRQEASDQQSEPASEIQSRFDNDNHNDNEQEAETGDECFVLALIQPASAAPTYRRSLFRR